MIGGARLHELTSQKIPQSDESVINVGSNC
jgi:hypothetical protein